jgi:hypothetical protein
MYREVLPDSVWGIFRRLSALDSMRSAYLAGGTGLAIQLGHRVSADLDFFFPAGFECGEIAREIPSLGMRVTVVNQTPGHCELMLDKTKVDFIRATIPLRFPLINLELDGAGCKVANPLDIGRMKLFSIASRGSRKDFIDLYCLVRTHVPFEKLLTLAVEEHEGLHFNRLLFLKGLLDFDEADREPQPIVLWQRAHSPFFTE